MRTWIVILAVVLLLSFAGCGNNAENAAAPTAYAAYEAVPDYGALFDLPQYSRADMGEVSIFAYADSDADFQTRCSMYAEAAAQLGETGKPVNWPDGQGCTLQCGDYTIYLAQHTENTESGALTLILVMVGTEAQFIAADALVTVPVS